MATFMAKWSKDWPGQSGHIHVSLQTARPARRCSTTPKQPHGMCDDDALVRRRAAGADARAAGDGGADRQLLPRLVPGFWAPTDATWGVENRTTALRVIPGGPKSQRVEYRIAAADTNPYIALAAALGSGLWGIENKIEPGPGRRRQCLRAQVPDQAGSCRAR